MVDLLVFRSSSSLQIFGFFQVIIKPSDFWFFSGQPFAD
jgi:hypothetical protein